MFLLNKGTYNTTTEQCIDLQYKMFLLNQARRKDLMIEYLEFTIQNVPIKFELGHAIYHSSKKIYNTKCSY